MKLHTSKLRMVNNAIWKIQKYRWIDKYTQYTSVKNFKYNFSRPTRKSSKVDKKKFCNLP